MKGQSYMQTYNCGIYVNQSAMGCRFLCQYSLVGPKQYRALIGQLWAPWLGQDADCQRQKQRMDHFYCVQSSVGCRVELGGCLAMWFHLHVPNLGTDYKETVAGY